MEKLSQSRWFDITWLALITGFTYLPHIGAMTYYRDNWYFLYNALVSGPTAFIDIALHTRPIRGPLYALFYSLFGLNPFPYHVTMYLTRLAGGVGVLWLYNLIWQNRRQANFFMAVLFLLFPGFLWWVAGFEFQPYVLSVTIQAFSIAFTLKAIATGSVIHRLGWTIAAILSGWTYLALVEYAIGMEAFRLICVYLYIRRNEAPARFIPTIVKTLKASILHLSIPIVFVFWYQFLFDNWRAAQDAGTQLKFLFTSPANLIWRLIDLVQSFLNVSIFAWVVPFYQNLYSNRLRDILSGVFFTALVIFLLWMAYRFKRLPSDQDHVQGEESSAPWRWELIWVGVLGTLCGVLPVILANRLVTFERFSQYTLPASMTGVILLHGLIQSVFPRNLRAVLFASVIGLAVLSHHGLAAQAVREEKTISDFWWQVVWRAPDIKTGTTLVAVYPNIDYLDGNDVVWGPANFIYAPEYQGSSPVQIPIAASRLESDSILEIINGRREFEQIDLITKFNSTHYNYKNQLILSQATESTCVRVIDPRWPGLSTRDNTLLFAAYQNSKIENVIPTGKTPAPQAYVFGAEPPHQWCYYFQKADLARQLGDWQTVSQLGEETQALNLRPNDQIEWLPFLQAYAILDNRQRVKELSTRINTEIFYKQQACQTLNSLADHGYSLSPEMQIETDNLFCD